MSLEMSDYPRDRKMGQAFYSEFAGHLFTARGTDKPGRISDTYFAGEGRQRLGQPQERMAGFSACPRLPSFDLDETKSRIRTLTLHGIILLEDHCPSYEALVPPTTAPLACLRLQPLDFELLLDDLIEQAEARPKQAYLQLVLLVACNWWDTLDTMLPQLYKTLSTVLPTHGPVYRKPALLCLVRALSFACSRGHEEALRCLLQFLLPEGVDMHEIRYQPEIIHPRDVQYSFLETLAMEGLGRTPEIDDDSKLDFSPSILQQLHDSFAKTDLLMVRSGNPLYIALQEGDATLSEIFITWMGSSNVSKLVKILDDGRGGNRLLREACENGLVDLAMRFIDAGAQITEGSFGSSSQDETYLHSTCRSRRMYAFPEKTVELVKTLYKRGNNLFAQTYRGQTPLHLAAASGKIAVVRYIITQTNSRHQRHPKDNNGDTPLMLAGSAEVRKEFAPWQPNSDGATSKNVCKSYWAQEFRWMAASKYFGVSIDSDVHTLLYEEGFGNHLVWSNVDGDIKWIHLPANHIEWCEDLLLGWYLGRDASRDTKDLEAARRPFDQQHVSRTPQRRFLRPGVHCTRTSRHIVFIAAPYMDYETSSNLEQMQDALRTRTLTSCSSTASDLANSNKALYDAYAGNAALHPRRTLDQYLYHNMDTSKRDKDQVIQRYQKNQANQSDAGSSVVAPGATPVPPFQPSDEGTETTTIMVDQLWMWILGDDLIVTCGAQRWDATRSDQGILARLEDYTSDLSLSSGAESSKVKAADVAKLFMTACFGTFDRHARGMPCLQFMSMFEQSLGVIVSKDNDLLEKFSAAYRKLGNKTKDSAAFLETLNNLQEETDLLIELKDIRDELHIMETILIDQQRVANEFRNLETKVIRDHKMSLSSSKTEEFEAMDSIINQGLQDIAKLDAQATRLSQSLSDLLQLKQAHYNAFQLKSSHKLALNGAKQGRAVLVFTIVTIIFSPLSFVAAFFTMNLTIFPEKLPLSYVSRYIFGLGFAIAIPCIILAFSLGWWTSFWDSVKKALCGMGPEPTDDREGLAKDESRKSSVQTQSSQEIHRLSNTSTTMLQNSGGRPSSSLREARSHDIPNMTTRLKR